MLNYLELSQKKLTYKLSSEDKPNNATVFEFLGECSFAPAKRYAPKPINEATVFLFGLISEQSTERNT
jgi:hypothetical protein